MNAIVPRNQTALTSPSKPLQTHLLRLSDAATDSRYPKKLTRAMVIATAESETQIRTALTYYRQSVAPASEEHILKHLLAMEVIYPSQQLSRDQKNLKYQIYYDALKDIPAAALDRAFQTYIRCPHPQGKTKFFPEPSEIRALAEQDIADAYRLNRGIALIEAALLDKTVQPTEEPTVSPERARELLANSGLRSIEQIASDEAREEILKRKPIMQDEKSKQLEADLRQQRTEALRRKLADIDHYGPRDRAWT